MLPPVEPLLLLSHRIPYPPNKGDKIRSFHLLKFLSRHFDIYLGTFIDDPEDRRYREKLKRFTVDQFTVEINPAVRKIISLRAIPKGRAMSIEYYAEPKLQEWVDKVIARRKIKHAYVMTSPMTQYLENHPQTDLVLDYVDLDSEKWQRLSEQRRGLQRWLLKREHDLLARHEDRVSKLAKKIFFASSIDSNRFNQRAGLASAQSLPNGIDSEFFNPGLKFDNPYPRKGKIIVFTGVMDYWINIEAVRWFCHKVLPLIVRQCPDTLFYIVGTRPGREIRSLEASPKVRVTGKVADVRPYLAHADLVVVPVRTECGFKNKLFEALAMKKPVVATSMASSCLDARIRAAITVENDADGMADKIVALLNAPLPRPGAQNCRKLLVEQFNWDKAFAGLADYFKLRPGAAIPAGRLEKTA